MSRAGAEALTVARRAAGLSQESLAQRAGVSSRTVRALESGQAKRPHRDTLLAVGDALGLRDEALEAFVAVWRSARREVEEIFAEADPLLVVKREIGRQRRQLRDRAIATVLRVRADGRWDRSVLRRRFEVISGEVDTFSFMAGTDIELVDLSKIVVTASSNVEVVATTPLTEEHAIVWTGRLGRTLHPGDVYELEFALDYGDAYRPGAPHSDQDNADLTVLQTSLTHLSLEVRFDPDVLPSRVWLSRRESLDGESVVVREVVVNDFGIAQVHLEPAPAGVHGLEWEWPDGLGEPS